MSAMLELITRENPGLLIAAKADAFVPNSHRPPAARLAYIRHLLLPLRDDLTISVLHNVLFELSSIQRAQAVMNTLAVRPRSLLAIPTRFNPGKPFYKSITRKAALSVSSRLKLLSCRW